MKEYTPTEFYSKLTESQLLELNEILQIMSKSDVHPLMADTEHIEGYVAEFTHFFKLSDPFEGLIYPAAEMDYFWEDGEVKCRATSFYQFNDEGELELERYKAHAQEEGHVNPILN